MSVIDLHRGNCAGRHGECDRCDLAVEHIQLSCGIFVKLMYCEYSAYMYRNVIPKQIYCFKVICSKLMRDGCFYGR